MKTGAVNTRKLSLAIRMALAVTLGSAASVGVAQDANADGQANEAKTMQTVVVTGSRIRQVNVENQQPIFTISSQEIQASGLVNAADIVREMPQIQTSYSSNQQTTQGLNPGASFADMRGLGPQRVLVLVNGHRWTSNSSGQTDLSTIPTSAIDHIEVLKDGASAIYGSDAVTGVINFITKKNFQGLEVHGKTGANEEGDGIQQSYGVTLGMTGDKGSVMFDLSYRKDGIMWNKTRELTSYGDGPRHPNAIAYLFNSRGQYTDSTGTYRLNEVGLDTTDPANYHQINPSQVPVGDQYNYFLDKPFRIPIEGKSAYGQGRYDFNDHVSFYADTIFSERRAFNQAGGYPLQSSTFRLSNGLISKDSLYNPTDQDVKFGIDYEDHPRSMRTLYTSTQIVSGLRGDLELGGHAWDWDVSLNYGKTSGSIVVHNNINLFYVQNAIGPSFLNNGVPTCGTPGAVVADCIPLNILGGPAALVPGQADKVFVDSRTDLVNTDMGYEASVSGGLFDLPAGEVGFAAGVDHRKLRGTSSPDAFTQSGLSSNNASAGTVGQYIVNAAYVEANIPVLKDQLFLKSLTFDIASRYSHYSNFGSTTNNKYGFELRPTDDLMIRGNYAEAFRAPSINDISAGISEGYGSYTDPCDARFGTQIYGAAVHNACVANLAQSGYANAADFRQSLSTGGVTNAPNTPTKNPFFSGATPGLMPETARDKTLGIVYSPSYVPGLGITLDWYQIKLENIISNVTANDVLQSCYQGLAAYCSRFSRDADGQVLGLFTGQANRGRATAEGYDFTATYQLPTTPIGDFRVRTDMSYMTKWEQQQSTTAKVEQRVGWATTSGYYWRLRGTTSLDWSLGAFNATWSIRYFSSLTEGCFWGKTTECNNPNHIDPYHGVFPTNRIGAVAFNDLSVGWKAPWDGRFTVGVKNLFNRAPPIQYQVPTGSPPINPAYDIDRFWFVGYVQKLM